MSIGDGELTINARDERSIKPCNSIADPYHDLLAQLDERRRRGMIRRLSVGYYEGWLPSRDELSILVDFELGRISETEFFATKRAATPAAPAPADGAGWTSPEERALGGRPQQPRGSRKGTVFHVDCGELAGRFRFVATRLRGSGWTVRDDKNYRLVFLEYELLPPVPADQASIGGRPPPFNAAILCVPDVPAPWAVDDGRSVRHVVGPQGISGSRGPWPVAQDVRRIKFVISRQVPPGSRSSGNPAGVLLIDIAGGRAAWNPVNGKRTHQGAAN